MKKDKQLQQIKNNPTDISFREIEKILINAGFTKRGPGKGSSHFTFTKGSHRITIPYAKPIGKIYIKKTTELIESISKEEANVTK